MTGWKYGTTQYSYLPSFAIKWNLSVCLEAFWTIDSETYDKNLQERSNSKYETLDS